jgi:hypothetical protein
MASGIWQALSDGTSASVTQFIRYIVLLNALIPISLYVTLELVKVIQCSFISMDRSLWAGPSPLIEVVPVYRVTRSSGIILRMTLVLMILSDVSRMSLWGDILFTHSAHPPPWPFHVHA